MKCLLVLWLLPKLFSVSLGFSSVITICLRMVFFIICSLDVHWASWICKFMSLNLQNFWPYFFLLLRLVDYHFFNIMRNRRIRLPRLSLLQFLGYGWNVPECFLSALHFHSAENVAIHLASILWCSVVGTILFPCFWIIWRGFEGQVVTFHFILPFYLEISLRDTVHEKEKRS